MNIRKYVLLIIVTLFMTGVMGTRLIIPLISSDYGASAVEIGIIVSVYSLLPLIISIKIGRSLDKIGVKLPFIVSIFLAGIGLVIPFISHHLVAIYVSQIITGVSQTIFVIAGQRYAGLFTSSTKRNAGIAQFTIGVSLGSFLGPMIGGAISDWYSFQHAFGLLGVISISAIVLVFVLTNIKKETGSSMEAKNKSIFSLLQLKPFRTAVIISSVILLSREVFITYFPLMASGLGYSTSLIGLIVSINTLAVIVIRLFMEKMLSHYSMMTVMRVSVVISAVTFIVLPFANHLVALFTISIILGFSLGIGQPLSISMTVNALSRDRVGEGLGARIAFNRLTQVVVPATFGGIAVIGGFLGVFLAVGLVLFGSTLTLPSTETENEKEKATG